MVIDGVEVNVEFKKVVVNIEGLDILLIMGVNVYDIFKCDILVIIKVGVEVLEV